LRGFSELRVLASVERIEGEAESHPDEEPGERRRRRRAHEYARAHRPRDGYDVAAAWNPKRTRTVRMPEPESHAPDADQHEREAGLEPALTCDRNAEGDGVRDVEVLVRDDSREHDGYRDVEHGADGERSEDPPRKVALGVFGFLRRGAHRVEPDVREEHRRRP